MTSDIDELELNAYLDGELDAEARARLEHALAGDPDAREKLLRLREQDAVVRAAISEPLSEPVPQDVTRQVQSMFAAAGERTPAAPAAPGRARLPLAMAASFAIACIGILAAFIVMQQRFDSRLAALETSRTTDQAFYDNALATALETHVSGDTVAWINPDTGATGAITPVRTFKATTNDWCREFDTVVSYDGASRTQKGVACRTADGIWQTRVLVSDAGNSGPDL
jgi:surface antigen